MSTGYLIDGVAPGSGLTAVSPIGATWSASAMPGGGLTYPNSVVSSDGYLYLFGANIHRAPLSNPSSLESLGNSSSIDNNFANYTQAIVTVGSTVYYYGGRASSTDATYASGAPIDRIFSAPLSDPTNVTEEVNVLPYARAWQGVVCNSSYIYLYGGGVSTNGGTNDGGIFRAPVGDPTNFTNIGSLSVGRNSQFYLVGSTVYMIAGTGSVSETIYSAPYSNLDTFSDTGETFPYYNGNANCNIIKCGECFVMFGGDTNERTDSIFICRESNPTKWFEVTGVKPQAFSTSEVYLLSGVIYAYSLRNNAGFQGDFYTITGGLPIEADSADTFTTTGINPLLVC
jgi:hypothetical protein